MGKSETAEVSIGIKILLSELVNQINAENVELVRDMLLKGYIEDENNMFNYVYQDLLDMPEDHNQLKMYLEHEFKTNGNVMLLRGCADMVPTLDDGCLLEQYLLVPEQQIIETTRWGYDRYGINCSSTPINFDLFLNGETVEKYKSIQGCEVVLIVNQSSG